MLVGRPALNEETGVGIAKGLGARPLPRDPSQLEQRIRAAVDRGGGQRDRLAGTAEAGLPVGLEDFLGRREFPGMQITLDVEPGFQRGDGEREQASAVSKARLPAGYITLVRFISSQVIEY